VGLAHERVHTEEGVRICSHDAVLLLIALQRLVNQQIQLTDVQQVFAEVEADDGILLPLPAGPGDEQLRLLDALLSGERLEQFAAAFEDSGQRVLSAYLTSTHLIVLQEILLHQLHSQDIL
jgi:hypothetical protein